MKLTYNKLVLNNKFLEWQNNTIFTKKYGNITIKQCIHYFANEGILVFLLKNGYTISRTKDDFLNGIATILYKLYINNLYFIKLPLDFFNDEFYDYFNFYTDWAMLWKVWNDDLNDFLQYNNTSNCQQLQDYIYSSLDFDKSPKYTQYIEENFESENDDNTKKKKEDIDPYLLENYHHKFVKFDV